MSTMKIAGLFAVSLCMMTARADAHPRLTLAGPAPGSTIAASPTSIRIEFSEAIEIGFSGIALTDAAGKAQETGDATVNPADKKQLIVPIKGTLAPGIYTVAWHAVGDDTHHVDGHYNFTVKP